VLFSGAPVTDDGYCSGLKPLRNLRQEVEESRIVPLPAKPQIQNTTAANNKGSLFSQTIAVSQPGVVAGQITEAVRLSSAGLLTGYVRVSRPTQVREQLRNHEIRGGAPGPSLLGTGDGGVGAHQ
jgi:hypothetical protein